MTHIATLITVLKTLGLLLGGLITYFSFKAYRRTGSPALRALAIGFGVVALGAVFAGVIDQVVPLQRNVALLIDSLFTTVGFAIILYSLYVE